MSLVLLVQPHQETAEQWADAMQRVGLCVVQAADVDRALTTVREGGLDVVVLDDGDASVLRFSASLVDVPDAPPVVFVSSSPQAPRISTQIGAAAFVPKPCGAAELAAEIDNLLQRGLPLATFEDEATSPNQTALRF